MGTRGAVGVLLVFAALAMLLLGWWRRAQPPAQPQDLPPGTNCGSRSCAHFIYDVYLSQCLAQIKPKNTILIKRVAVSVPGVSSQSHSETMKELGKGEKRDGDSPEDTAMYKEEQVEWATDGENGVRDVMGRRNDADDRGRSLPTANTHPSSLIGHILLGALLLLSAGIALCEVFRDRLREKRSPPTVTNKFSAAAAADLRRCSLADLTVIRHARRESVQKAAAATVAEPLPEQTVHAHSTSRHRLTTAASFDSGLGLPSVAPPPRASYRILGSRPPPLQRRSSFPVPLTSTVFASGQSDQAIGATQHSKLSRRSSVEQSEDESSPDLRRRVRIIRRH